MKKLFQWMMAAILICGAMTFTACSSSDDDGEKKTDDGVLTPEKLAGVWYANYADDQTEGDLHWTSVVEDYKFNADGTGYLEYFQTDGNKLVDALFVRDNGKLHYTIIGDTVTVTVDAIKGATWKFNYADGKLLIVNDQSSMVYSQATSAQQTEVDQLYAEWKGANSDTEENLVNLSQSCLSYFPGEITIQDGQIVTGTLARNVKISIAPGATVTLRDANISCLSRGSDYAGITCDGDATILLEGNNTVLGGILNAWTDEGLTGYGNYPGIFIPKDHTLTINGTGSLVAKYGGPEEYAQYAAGIGGCGYEEWSCGNIVILGGTIYAYGGNACPGIGSGCKWRDDGWEADCGDITISGGIVYAYGGYSAPAIGSSIGGKCGNITIDNTVTKVTATKGDAITEFEMDGITVSLDINKNCIGCGEFGSCGTVTIAGTVYYDGTNYVNGGDTYITRSPLICPTATGRALASAKVGEIICSDGLAYDGINYDNLPRGVTARAKVCYVSGDGHGLALALADEGQMNWSTAKSTCEGKTPTITGCTWKLATEDEWNNMISGAGGYEALRDGFTSVGGSNLQESIYWSSTESDGNDARIYRFFNGFSWSSCWKDDENGWARACLAF